MLKTSINGQTYCIRFGYAQKKSNGYIWAGKALTNIHNKRIFTFCEIQKKTNDTSYPWEGVAADFAIRHPTDTFVKAEGRSIAFAMALKQIPNRNIRKALADTYNNRHVKY